MVPKSKPKYVIIQREDNTEMTYNASHHEQICKELGIETHDQAVAILMLVCAHYDEIGFLPAPVPGLLEWWKKHKPLTVRQVKENVVAKVLSETQFPYSDHQFIAVQIVQALEDRGLMKG